MNTEKLKTNFVRLSFFLTRPGMIIVNLVLIFILYQFDQGIGFFYILTLATAVIVRTVMTPDGQFFKPLSYDGYSPNNNENKKNQKPKKYKKTELNIDNHEKIDDRHEMKQINRKFKQIEEEFKENGKED